MALPGNLSISEEALEHLTQKCDIGELHYILRPTPVWLNDTERGELHRRLEPELANLPIYEAPGRLDRDFENSLRCLCHPEVAYIAATHVQGEYRFLLACSLGREGILAVREHGRIVLRQADADALPNTLVAALPDHPPAQFQPISVPLGEQEAEREPGVLQSSRGGKSDARRRHDELVEHPPFGAGQIHVELRDAMGRKRSNDDFFLGFVDADLGRWYHVVEQRGDKQYIFCAPMSKQQFPTKLRALQDQLAAAR